MYLLKTDSNILQFVRIKSKKSYQTVRLMVFTAYNLKLTKIQNEFYILQNEI